MQIEIKTMNKLQSREREQNRIKESGYKELYDHIFEKYKMEKLSNSEMMSKKNQ